MDGQEIVTLKWLLYIALIGFAQVSGERLTANIQLAPQLDLLMKDLIECFRHPMHSAKEQMESHRSCFQTRTSHCLYKWNDPPKKLQVPSRSGYAYCGSIVSQTDEAVSKQKTLSIQLIEGFIINTDIMIFNFEWHPALGRNGLSFSDSSRHIPPFYHGKRLPWNIIIPSNKATVTITTQIYLQHHFNLFYFSYKRQWLSNLHHVNNIVFSKIFLLNTFDLFSKRNVYKVNTFHYSILGKGFKKLNISFSSNANSLMIITLFDGPGEKSQSLLELDCMIYCHHNAITSTYAGYVQIENVIPEKKNNLTIAFQELSHRHYRRCQLIDHRVMERSSHIHNKACITAFSFPYGSLFFHVRMLSYIGPTAALPDHDTYNCQYGGVFILLPEHISICANKSNGFIAHAIGTSLRILVVWFHGYSRGVISAVWIRTHCVRHSKPMGLVLKRPTIIDDSKKCQTYICSSINRPYQGKCEYLVRGLHGRPIGSTTVGIGKGESLFKCIPSHTNGINQLRYNFTVNQTENWPLGHHGKLKDLSSEVNTPLFTSFKYMVEAFVSLPYLCTTNDTSKEMSFSLMIASCEFEHTRSQYLHYPSQGMQMLTNDCFNMDYSFSSNDVPHLIYKEDPTTNYTGSRIRAYYGEQCSHRCRSYTYTVYIWQRFENSVLERVANIGEYIFTGFNYQGLRITIKGPKLPCKWTDCIIIVNTAYLHSHERPPERIHDQDTVWKIDSRKVRFYSKR